MKSSPLLPVCSLARVVALALAFLVLAPGASARAAEPAPAGASFLETCEVGVYVNDLTDLDFKNNSFKADFYIWFKTRSQRFSPDHLEFMNGDIAESKVYSVETIETGIRYIGYHQKGTFRVKFPLHHYPFDAQALEIHVENSRWNQDNLIFVPERRTHSGTIPELLARTLQIENWVVHGAELATDSHMFRTDFGDPTVAAEGDTYSRLVVRVHIRRILLPILLKFMLPIMIILMTASLVLFIHASEFESQCQITITALLSAIAFHISQADTLPAVGYMTTVDKFFMLAYAYIFLTLVELVVVNRYSKTGRGDRALAVNTWTLRILPTSFFAALLLIFWSSYSR